MFEYKYGNSFLHKIPSWIKILFVPVINILVFMLPIQFSLSVIFIQFIFALILKLSFLEIIKDLKPVIFFALMIFICQIISCVFSDELNFKNIFLWENQKETVYLLIKIFCIMQSSSLIFKSTTMLEFRKGVFSIERIVRKIFFLKKKESFSDLIYIFLSFIPMMSRNWNESKRAWIIRKGKKSIKMYFVLFSVLFSVGLKNAYDLWRGISARNFSI